MCWLIPTKRNYNNYMVNVPNTHPLVRSFLITTSKPRKIVISSISHYFINRKLHIQNCQNKLTCVLGIPTFPRIGSGPGSIDHVRTITVWQNGNCSAQNLQAGDRATNVCPGSWYPEYFLATLPNFTWDVKNTWYGVLVELLAFFIRIHRSPVYSPHKESATQGFHISFVAIRKILLKKQSSCLWFETPFGRHCNIPTPEEWLFITRSICPSINYLIN